MIYSDSMILFKLHINMLNLYYVEERVSILILNM